MHDATSASGADPAPTHPYLRVAALLLHWRDAAATWQQVERLQKWTNPPDLWVVENEPLGSWPKGVGDLHRLSPDRNLGYAAGVNAGWQAMPQDDYDAVLLLNTDTALEEPAFLAMVGALMQFSDIGVIGPRLEEPDGQGTRSYDGGRDPVRWTHTRIPSRRDGPPLQDVDYVPGTACLIRLRTLSQMGGLAAEYFFSGEVADFCLRARSAGWRCVVHTRAIVRHDIRQAGLRRDTLYLYYSLRNRFLLARHHRPRSWLYWWLVWTLRGVGMLTLRLARGRPSSARAVALALWDAWTGHFGQTGHSFPA